MKNYDQFKYIYPPRPETKSPPSGLDTYERMGFIGQPKLNGSCGVLFTDGKEVRFMGRHNNTFSRELIDRETLKGLHRGTGWIALTGEFMNKSQKDSKGLLFNGKFVIFDILVYNGVHLISTTFQERQEILDELYPKKPYDKFIDRIDSHVYRVKNFKKDFSKNWKELTSVGMYEGWVLKRPNAKLENGLREANNTGWMVKIRKVTRNYQY